MKPISSLIVTVALLCTAAMAQQFCPSFDGGYDDYGSIVDQNNSTQHNTLQHTFEANAQSICAFTNGPRNSDGTYDCKSQLIITFPTNTMVDDGTIKNTLIGNYPAVHDGAPGAYSADFWAYVLGENGPRSATATGSEMECATSDSACTAETVTFTDSVTYTWALHGGTTGSRLWYPEPRRLRKRGTARPW